MAEISAKIVMELRGRTGAGMMDCKKALAAVEGDMEKAIDYLREKGLAAAAKKQSRIAAEGLVGSFVCKECATGALVEVNCETDFVAKTDKFKALVSDVAEQVAVLFAGNQGYFDDLAISQVLEFRDGLVTYLKSSYGKILERLRTEKIAGDLESDLDRAIADYKRDFAAKHVAESEPDASVDQEA